MAFGISNPFTPEAILSKLEADGEKLLGNLKDKDGHPLIAQIKTVAASLEAKIKPIEATLSTADYSQLFTAINHAFNDRLTPAQIAEVQSAAEDAIQLEQLGVQLIEALKGLKK